MEKDIGKISKNSDTDILIRVDDFGGKIGLTIREFVKSERYTGFTKAGTRIPADKFKEFKALINSIDENDFEGMVSSSQTQEASPGAKEGGAGKIREAKKSARKEKPLSDIEEKEF